jgi:hypothetical protein
MKAAEQGVATTPPGLTPTRWSIIMAKAGREPNTPRDDTPLIRLCTLWRRQNLAIEVCGADDALADRRGESLAETERQIARAPAWTPAGLLAKLAIYEHHVMELVDAENPGGVEELALSLIGDVRRILVAATTHKP